MMMSLKENLLSDMKEAMKEKNVVRKNTIQMVRGSILQKEKDTLKQLSEEEILEIIIQEVKKRKDAIVDFEKGDRQDLVTEAEAEITVLKNYLPKQLSDNEVSAIVVETIAEIGANSMKDMGKVMAALMPKVKGKADNAKVSTIVKQELS